MYPNVLILFVALTSFFLVARSDKTLECYKCISLGNRNCGHKLKESSTLRPEECGTSTSDNENLITIKDSSNQWACAKVEYKVPIVNEVVTKRDCVTSTADYDINNFCSVMRSNFGGSLIESCSVCHRDGCNGAIAASPRIIHVILPALGSLVFAFILYRDV